MAAEIKKAGKETIRRLKMAWGFLTVFPTDTGEYKEGDLSRASFFFPAVGAVIGAVNASLFYLLHFLTRDSLLPAFLVTFIWIFLTGAYTWMAWPILSMLFFWCRQGAEARDS